MFNTRTFKSVGPPKEIIRIYRVSTTRYEWSTLNISTIPIHQFFLAFLVCLEVSVFCLVAAMSLWITELMNGAIALISTRTSTGISLAQFVISITVCSIFHPHVNILTSWVKILLPWFTMASCLFPSRCTILTNRLTRRGGSPYAAKRKN